jgi:predicted DNA-binding transcriptional regulator YafY
MHHHKSLQCKVERHMRADRLLAILMLLQARGKLTAQALAQELEVSERTIYRDVEALSIAGVPVYSESGPGGGIGLLESYRTTLTGLTDAEAAALFVLSIPAPLDEIGLREDLRSALRKLAAALPTTQRDARLVHQLVHVDAAGWQHDDEPTPHLRTLHAALQEAQPVLVRYRRLSGAEVVAEVEPYGLVAKAGVWHLVYARHGRVHVIPVADLGDVQPLPGRFARPIHFDLLRFWEQWCADAERWRTHFVVTVRVAPLLLPHLAHHFGAESAARAASAPRDDAGWITLSLTFDALDAARTRLLGLGNAVEVLAPAPLRRSIADFAERIVEMYGSGSK